MIDVDDADYVLLVPPSNFGGGGSVVGMCLAFVFFFNSYFKQLKIRIQKIKI